MSHERIEMNNTITQKALLANQTTDNNDDLLRTQHLLGQLNNGEIHRLLPLSLYLVLVSVIGIPGNAVVCHIYRKQCKRSNSIYFILCLSAIDLFTCLFVVPFELFTIQNQYTYTAKVACKLARFCNSAPTVTNGFMFLLIAIDRYRKVCQPLRWQIRPKMAKMLCVGSVVCGVFFSWPVLVLYGKKTFTVERFNITASECSIDDSVNGTVFPFVLNSLLGFLFVVGTTSLISLYAIIGRAISKHAKDIVHFQRTVQMKNLRGGSNGDNYSLSQTMDDGEVFRRVEERSREGQAGNRETISSSIENEPSDVFLENDVAQNYPGSPETTLDRSNLSKTDKGARSVSFEAYGSKSKTKIYKKSPNRAASYATGTGTGNKIGKNDETKIKPSGFLRKLSSIGSCTNARGGSDSGSNGVDKEPKRNASQKMRRKRSRKTSWMMFLITLAYIVSYLPHVALMLKRAISSDFVESMSDGERAVYKFFLRSYFFNCVVNPFIYSACDVRFKNGVSELLGSIVDGFFNSVSRNKK